MPHRLQLVLEGLAFISRSLAPRFAPLSPTPFADARRRLAASRDKVWPAFKAAVDSQTPDGNKKARRRIN